MTAARQTAENGFRLPAPADRWIQAKRDSFAGRVYANLRFQVLYVIFLDVRAGGSVAVGNRLMGARADSETVNMTVSIPAALRNRARAAYRATSYAEGITPGVTS